MSEVKQIKAVARDRAGKGAARAVRRQGQVPAVIYGGGHAAEAIALDFNETKQLIFAGHFLTTVFEIDVKGQKTRAIPRDYQLDPVKDTALHVDFLRIGKGAKINVKVPVHFANEEASPGIKRGGVLNIVHHTLDLTVDADHIPEEVVVDLTGLDVGQSIHISAIKLPTGAVDHSHEADLTIATIVAPSGLRAEEAEAGAAEGAAEGEATE